MPTLCLGEALVDARSFVPHPGGATANVAVHAARLGAEVELAGGAGDDAWGPGCAAVSRARASASLTSPSFRTPERPSRSSPSPRAASRTSRSTGTRSPPPSTPSPEEALAGAEALFFASNTLVGREEREVTMRARELALAAGMPVVLDANPRLARWSTVANAVAAGPRCGFRS